LGDSQKLRANDVAHQERPRVGMIEQIADAVACVNTLDRRSRGRLAHYPRPDAQSYFVKLHKLARSRSWPAPVTARIVPDSLEIQKAQVGMQKFILADSWYSLLPSAFIILTCHRTNTP
jgi:hypothetical protein